MTNQMALENISRLLEVTHYFIIKYFELLLKNLFLTITLNTLFMFGELSFVEFLTPLKKSLNFEQRKLIDVIFFVI